MHPAILTEKAIPGEVPDGRKAAGGLEEEGDACFLQAGEARPGHVAHGPAENQGLGERRMDRGNLLRHFQRPVGGGNGKVQEEEVEILILGEGPEIAGDDLGVVHELGGNVHGVGDGSHRRRHIAKLVPGPVGRSREGKPMVGGQVGQQGPASP